MNTWSTTRERHHSRRPGHPLRIVAVALIALLIAGIVTKVFWTVTASSWADISGPGPDSPADLLVMGLAALGAVLSAWLGLGFAAAALAALPGSIGVAAETVADRLAPAAVRRTVAFLLGTALTATLAPGTAAAATTTPSDHRTTTSQTIAPVPDPAFRPTVDGPVAPDPDFHPTTTHQGASGAPLTVTATRPSEGSDAPPVSTSGPASPGSATTAPTTPPSSPSTTPAGPAANPAAPNALPVPDPDFHPTTRTSASGAEQPAFTASAPAAPRQPQTLGPLGNAPKAGTTVEEHVVVHRGDSLWDIAARHLGPDATSAEIAHEWPRWYAANHALIGGDPDLLVPGQLLTPPTNGATS